MERRYFVQLGSRIGFLVALVPAIARRAFAQVDTGTTDLSSGISPILIQQQGAIVTTSGSTHLRHPKHLSTVAKVPGALYDGTIIEFRSDGVVTFSNGHTLSGSKGDKYKLVCIRDAKSKTVLVKRFLKALSGAQVTSANPVSSAVEEV